MINIKVGRPLGRHTLRKSAGKAMLGFTLIEVMLAMAVFAIAGVALLSAASNNARNIGHLESIMFANWVASNQLVEISLATQWPQKTI